MKQKAGEKARDKVIFYYHPILPANLPDVK